MTRGAGLAPAPTTGMRAGPHGSAEVVRCLSIGLVWRTRAKSAGFFPSAFRPLRLRIFRKSLTCEWWCVCKKVGRFVVRKKA